MFCRKDLKNDADSSWKDSNWDADRKGQGKDDADSNWDWVKPQQRSMKGLEEVIRFWCEQRQAPDGQFGGGWGEPTATKNCKIKSTVNTMSST